MKELELLSPAKNYEYGVAAINCGADAVYIGADKFGARSGATNSIFDIQKLSDYAHKYNSKVYAAFNTILYDNELEPARNKIFELWNAGVDALIIQDMALLEMDLPPLPLFASTQTDNREIEQIKFFEKAGFERIILARELSLDQIKQISRNVLVDLEAFVHGALCVSYSGRCYLSAALGGRSANRGECGQPCRLLWNLVNDNNEIIVNNKHLLSLKDMCRINYIEELIDAGVSSFKIEGRLKDISYVKNITALYRKALDKIIESRNDLTASSSGKINIGFEPDHQKTFTRGDTLYFLNGKRDDCYNFETPKSVGEKLGVVDKVFENYFTLKSSVKINNGDGLCFFDKSSKLCGIKVNKVENNKIFPFRKKQGRNNFLTTGTMVYRNYDHNFLKLLDSDSGKRKIGLKLIFRETETGFSLKAIDEDNNIAVLNLDTEKTEAINAEQALKNIKKQISKLGATDFYCMDINIDSKPYFIQASLLNSLRRDVVFKIEELRKEYNRKLKQQNSNTDFTFIKQDLDYSFNISNEKSRAFYTKHGVNKIEPAFELLKDKENKIVMTSKHCIRFALGECLKQKKSSLKGPLYLENSMGKLELEFDCVKCEMSLCFKGK